MNINKSDAYQLVLSNLNFCIESKDVCHLIGLIASCESIMSDRLSAFLEGTKNAKYLKDIEKMDFVSFGNLLKYSKKELSTELQINSKSNTIINTKNLFIELMQWKNKRNNVIHAVCKSKSTVSHDKLTTLFADVKNCCIDGHRLLRLLLKWSDQTKRKYNKSQMENL